MMQKHEKWLKPWHMVIHLKVLSKTYPMSIGLRMFKKKSLGPCALYKSSPSIRRLRQFMPNIFMTSGVWICVVFGNNFGIRRKFRKYLMTSCKLEPH